MIAKKSLRDRVLDVLNLAEMPLEGQAIIKEIVGQRKGFRAWWDEVNVYPTIRKLERDGEVESWEGSTLYPERGNRPRRYYKRVGLPPF